MRKVILVIIVLLIATSTFAAPNDSSDRGRGGAIARIIRAIKHVIAHPLDAEQPGTPTPSPTPQP
jgi:predicted small secreted protein